MFGGLIKQSDLSRDGESIISGATESLFSGMPKMSSRGSNRSLISNPI